MCIFDDHYRQVSIDNRWQRIEANQMRRDYLELTDPTNSFVSIKEIDFVTNSFHKPTAQSPVLDWTTVTYGEFGVNGFGQLMQ